MKKWGKMENKDKKEKIEEPEKTVVVSQKYLEDMEARMKRMEATTSKARLGIYDDKNKKPSGSRASIRKFEDKYVVGWGNMIVNRVEQSSVTGRWEEVQEVEIWFINGTKSKMKYKTWKDRYEKVRCPILSQKPNENDSSDVTLELPEGEKVTLDIKFVN